MKRGTGSSEVQLLLMLLDEGYSRKTWHGPNLRGSLRGIAAESAARRPAPERHNIWEVAVHAAYWKYVARRRLLGDKRGSFALKGSNWFATPTEVSSKAWKDQLTLLDQEHLSLKAAVASLKPGLLRFTPVGSKFNNLALIGGIANHDIYHAGQIQLLKRLQGA